MNRRLRIARHSFRPLAAGLLVAGLLAAPFGALAASSQTVEVLASSYDPQTFTVEAGTTVVFKNTSTFPHTATADDGSFDTGMISQGEAKSVTLEQLGTIAFHCQFHGGAGGVGQSGTITVTAAPAASPGATAKAGGNAPAGTPRPNLRPPSSDLLPDLPGGLPGLGVLALAIAALSSVAITLALDWARRAANRGSGS